MTDTPQKPAQPTKVRIRYDSMETIFASQFVVNATREELVVNFSPGFITDPQSGENLLPIQARIALTPAGAARLMQTLDTVLRRGKKPTVAEEGVVTSTELQ